MRRHCAGAHVMLFLSDAGLPTVARATRGQPPPVIASGGWQPHRAGFVAAFTGACTLSAIACEQHVAVPTPTVRAISVTGRDLYLGFISTAQYTASAVLSDGTSQDITSAATWQSSNESVATVASSTGEVRAVTYGTATITARYHGAAGARSVNVLCGLYLGIIPNDPLQVAVGTTATLRTFAEFVTPMYEPIFATLSSSRPDVATVAPKPQTIDWTLTAIAAGQTTIHATHGCGAADLLVTVTR
jgi:hypothetical protein